MSTRREFLKLAAATSAVSAHPLQLASATPHDTKTPTRYTSNDSLPAHIRAVIRRDDTIVRHGGNGDNWHMSWAANDRQYLSLCDGVGFCHESKITYNSRMLTITGGPRDAKFYDIRNYPLLGSPTQRGKDPRYYGFGTLALDARLYQFLSTFNRPFRDDEPKKNGGNDPMRFIGAKLIFSPDEGRTWHNQDGSTPVIWEDWNQRSRENMVFFEEDQESFSLLTVLQMGKNYEKNLDGYIYIYAPNGNTEWTMRELVMLRAPTGKIVDRASYEYFAGRSANGSARWSKDIMARAVVHTFPPGWVNTSPHPYAWHPSVVYNPALRLYMMASWGMGIAAGGAWFSKPSYFGIWVAAAPWGPWIQVHEETAWTPGGDTNARCYQPQIAPRWIAPDGRSFWLVWTDFQGHDSPEMKQFTEEYKRKAEANRVDEMIIQRTAAMMRRHMPYYSFNAQQIELALD